MSDVMVTARMSKARKEQALAVLEKLGTTPSEAINGLFEYVIANGTLPYGTPRLTDSERAARIREANAWADGLPVIPIDDDVDILDDKELRLRALVNRGDLEPDMLGAYLAEKNTLQRRTA